MPKKNALFIAGLVLLLLMAVPLAIGQEDDTTVAPPIVVDTNPIAGEELGLEQFVSFTFDRPMNTEATANEFSVEPALEGGEWSWEEDARHLVYSPPSEGYARDTEYRFSVFAEDADGIAMEEPFTLELRTTGFLTIGDVLPADGSEGIEFDATITIVFNRPVVPVVRIDDQDELPNPITIEPETPGMGEWLNTSIFMFTPDPGFIGGTSYEVTVNSGLIGVDGSLLAEDYTFGFTTAVPEVTRIYPRGEATRILLDPTIEVYFTQPMNPETQGGIQLLDFAGNRVELEYTWDDDLNFVRAEPTELLELSEVYEIYVDRTIVRGASGAELPMDYRQTFQTVPYPAISSTRPEDGDRDARPYGGFAIYFTGPIDEETLVDKVTIEPEPWREYESYYYDYDYRYSLFFDTEPSTDYTITIAPGIADIYGNVIEEEMVVRYRTDAYEPEVTLNIPDFVGLYNAYNPTTRLFITHRNAEQLELQLFEVDIETLAQFTGPDSYQYIRDFAPDEDQRLRAWQIPLEAELNTRRYELVTLSTEGGVGDSIVCLGAPETRLAPGMQARISDEDPTPLNIRSAPNLNGTIITKYDPGVVVNITGMAVCADNYLWWPIENPDDNITGWMAEGSLGLYFAEPVVEDEASAAGEEEAEEELPPPLPAGVYYLEVESPATRDRGQSPDRHTLMVTTVNITMKYGPDEILAWVTDMQSGEPVSDVRVNFYNADFNQIAFTSTDDDGLATAILSGPPSRHNTYYAVVGTDEHFGFVTDRFSGGISPWNFDVYFDPTPETMRVYMYTDRPIYRPDQTVYFKGIIREKNDINYGLPDSEEAVLVTVYDNNRQVIHEEPAVLTPYGSFSGEFSLDAEAGLGFYRIVASVRDVDGDVREFSVSFNVAEYRAPEFQVTVNPEAEAVVQGETIEVEVESRYFFGAPVSNADIRWDVIASNYFFNYDGPGRWQFIDFSYDEGPREFYGPSTERIANGESLTDDQGIFTIEIPAELGERTQSQSYTIEATVVDESDQAVSGRARVIVHQGLYYIGLSPDNYVGQANQETGFQLLTVDWDSEPVTEQPVDYRVVERRWSSVQEKDPQGRTIWTYEVEEIEIDSGSVTTDENGRAHINFTPPNGGVFKIYAEGRDTDGNRINSSAYMWVSGSDYVAWRQQNSNRIELISDADSYSVGDTAEILIASPFQGETQAMITVERAGILETEIITMENNSYVYELPIEPEYAPNVFVSVTLVKGVDDTNPYTQFRVGMIQLDVDTERLMMNVEVTPLLDPDEIVGPGDEVELAIRTTDWQGEPVQAEVGISMSDLAVLSIAAPNTGPLLPFFYGEQGLAINTANALTASVDQVTQTIIDTIKGGGGGGGGGGIFEIRQDFVDTPLWEPSVITDENGEGRVTVTLPDNLTTWRVDARSVTDGEGSPMLVGQTTVDVISTKPLLIRPVTPRFMVVGDIATLGAIVNNNTKEEQNVTILMEGSGFTVLDEQPLAVDVSIPAGGRERVDWTVEIEDVEFVDVFFATENEEGTLQDASKPVVGLGDEQLLPVHRYVVPETVGTSGTLYGPESGSRTELIVLPERLDATQGELRIKLNRSLAGPMLDGLDYLQNYPHQCIEQTVSRFLPNVITMRALTALNQSNPQLEANLEAQVNFGLQRLYSQQKVDGGWGWFPNDESNPLTTAYALIGLVEAKDSGFPVDDEVIEGATGFLRQYLFDTDSEALSSSTSSWRLNRRAFVLYALARAGQGNASRMAALYTVRERLNLDAKAYLAMGLMIVNPDDSRVETLMSDFNNAATVSATGTHWEDRPDRYNWTTDTRSSALVMKAIIQHDPQNALLPGAVRWLMVARQADAWETTQETAWAVMALTDWMVATQELEADYTFAVRLNEDLLPIEDDTATTENVKEDELLEVQVAELLLDEANRVTFIRSDGTGNLYYTAHVRTFQDVPAVEPASRGIIINRKYHLATDEDEKSISSANVGEEVVVTLTIIAPRNLHYVVVEDPIPAGAEAVDPNLLTTSVIGERPSLSRSDPLSRGWGWWWFSRTEFRDEKVVMYSTYLPSGTYTYTYRLRMGLEGEYNVIPTTANEFYFHEVYGRSSGMLFTINRAVEGEIAASVAEETALVE